MPYLGLIKRKERWALTVRGWLVLIVFGIGALAVALVCAHPFLAVTNPVKGDILVVEGWLPDYALEKVIDEFRSNKYRMLVTTGGPLSKGFYLAEYKTTAELVFATLKHLGFDEELLAAVPGPDVRKDSTYASAVALKKWLLESGLSVKALNIFSMGPHARRTRLLFEKALGDNVKVGIIALESQEYDPKAWWKTSKGVRAVIGEGIAYLYARFFFWPKMVDG